MINLFRLIALVEGVTTLALFLFAMPMKYLFDQPQYVPTIGLAHGAAFVAYIVGMLVLLRNRGFSDADWFRNALIELGISPCIPSRLGRKVQIPHDAALYRLRHKIEPDPGMPQLLQTAAVSGYKLVVD